MSLAFDIADCHVALGRGELPAWTGPDGERTFVDLVEQSAEIAGAVKRLGILEDGGLRVDLAPSWERLVVVVALLRLGVVPADGGAAVFNGNPPLLHLEHETAEWGHLVKVGRVDPAAAYGEDDAHLLDRLPDADRTMLEELIAGRPVGAP